MQRCRARDFYELPSSRETTSQGFLRAPAKIARTGVQPYTCRELGMDGGDKVLKLYRPPEEVAKSARSFESVPMADDHPPGDITADNWKTYAVGTVRDVSMEGEFLSACVIVQDGPAIDLVRDGKAELSCGYSFDLDMTPGVTPAGESYDAIQRDITGNHVAIVDRGRAGSRVRIADRKGQTTMLIRLKAADAVINPKVTIVGFDQEIEIADAASARRVQDAFDLHKHGIEAAKDAHDKLCKDHKDLQSAFDEYKAGMAEVGDDDDADVDEMNDDESAEMEAEESAEGGKKKTGDGKRFVGYTADGAATLRYRLKRALDRAAKYKAQANDTAAHEKRAEERAAVIDAAKPLLGEEFEAKGKTIHEIRLAAIDAAGKDEELAKVVKPLLRGGKAEKLSATDAAVAFDTIVAASGRAVVVDNGGDEGLSRALAGGDQASGGGRSSGPSGRQLWIQRSATDSRKKAVADGRTYQAGR